MKITLPPGHHSKMAGILGVVLLLAMTPITKAETFISTLGEPYLAPLTVNSGGSGGGFSFFTGSNAPGYSLTSITISIYEGEVADPAGSLFAGLYALDDETFLPTGAALTTFSHGAIPVGNSSAAYAQVVFSPDSEITLSAETGYAIILLSTGGNRNWNLSIGEYNSDFSPSGTDWSIPSAMPYTINNGSSFTTMEGYSINAAVNAEAVPEPTAALLVMSGVGVLFLSRKRRMV